MTKQYNYCLDYIKGIACIFVVCMHCEFPGIMGATVQTISRFCVPFFSYLCGGAHVRRHLLMVKKVRPYLMRQRRLRAAAAALASSPSPAAVVPPSSAPASESSEASSKKSKSKKSNPKSE